MRLGGKPSPKWNGAVEVGSMWGGFDVLLLSLFSTYISFEHR